MTIQQIGKEINALLIKYANDVYDKCVAFDLFKAIYYKWRRLSPNKREPVYALVRKAFDVLSGCDPTVPMFRVLDLIN